MEANTVNSSEESKHDYDLAKQLNSAHLDVQDMHFQRQAERVCSICKQLRLQQESRRKGTCPLKECPHL